MPVVLEDGHVTEIGSPHERVVADGRHAERFHPPALRWPRPRSGSGTVRQDHRKDHGVSSAASITDETPCLSRTQVTSWQRDGFLVLDRLIGSATTAALRAAYDDLLARQDTNPSDRMLGGLTRQVMRPAQAHPLFDRNPAVDNALGLAQQLFGTDQVGTDLRHADLQAARAPARHTVASGPCVRRHAVRRRWYADARSVDPVLGAPGRCSIPRPAACSSYQDGTGDRSSSTTWHQAAPTTREGCSP